MSALLPLLMGAALLAMAHTVLARCGIEACPPGLAHRFTACNALFLATPIPVLASWLLPRQLSFRRARIIFCALTPACTGLQFLLLLTLPGG
ncbi:hypothetical protein AB0M29_28515 [Streptomyces sp. NPDC051976]|uniref:hypothetical protein n=1 Tax=Streptomyces sp. NPDC051976 TaxID=3154947 RepID=UPI00343DB9AB